MRFVIFANALLLGTLIASNAQALVELKGGYSLFNTSPSALNDAFAANPKITQMQALSADVMVNVPLMPVGLGVRYEMFGREETSGSFGSTIDWKRTSIIANMRFIDTLIYLGPIASVSFVNDFKYKSTTAGVTTEYKTDSKLNGTIGVEAGLKLVLIRIGAEIGYLYAPMGELKTSTGAAALNASGGKIDFDMSGTYARVTAGFGF